MALEIEDGTGKSNSVSYISETDLDTYTTLRNITLTATAGAEKEALLVQAMDYLESMCFIGYKYTEAQALQWPRYGAVLDNYYIDVDTIPQLLKDAQAEIAVGIDGGDNPLSNVPRETIKEKVGDIEVEYKSGSMSQTYLKAAHTKLDKLVKSNTTVYRA